MRTAYFISGMGADERAFQLLDIGNVNRKYIGWLVPENREPFGHYIRRLSEQIDDPRDGILVGLSFGGIIAVELSELLRFHRTVIISSVKSREEMPLYLRLLRYSRIYRAVPERFLNRYNPAIRYAFGVSSRFENDILKEVIETTDPKLVRWAIDAIVNWDRTSAPEGIIHIHGTGDRLFPYRNIRGAIPVEGGSHFMIVNKSDRIGAIINGMITEG